MERWNPVEEEREARFRNRGKRGGSDYMFVHRLCPGTRGRRKEMNPNK